MRPYRKADQSPGELAVKVTKSSKAGMAGMPQNDVIENFDLQELARSDEIASNFDVRLGWSRITARMIVCHDDCRCTRHDC